MWKEGIMIRSPRTVRLILWIVGPLIAGTLVYRACAEFRLFDLAVSMVTKSPLIEYPTTLDLGAHELGETVTCPVVVANRGTADLLISEIQSSCSCSGLAREREGGYFRVENLQLSPGQEEHLLVRVAVENIRPGNPVRYAIDFRTNDPKQPQGRIEAIIRCVNGGITTTPESVVFGTVQVGTAVRQIIDIWDMAAPPRIVTRVTSTIPDRVSLRLLAPGKQASIIAQKSSFPVIARLEVTVKTNQPGDVNGLALIELAERPNRPDGVPIIGRVARIVELTPSVLALPRRSADGLVWNGTCICKSTNGTAFMLKPDLVPAGFTADISPSGEAVVHTITITLDPEQRKTIALNRDPFRFRARVGDTETSLHLPVRLTR
jgi:hypothetical protein